jgi:hypothetical protein
MRLDPPCSRATLRRGSNLGEGGNIASNGRVVQALILLLAACEQARHELDQADVVADGLREELNTLSVRLQDVLVQERGKSAAERGGAPLSAGFGFRLDSHTWGYCSFKGSGPG